MGDGDGVELGDVGRGGEGVDCRAVAGVGVGVLAVVLGVDGGTWIVGRHGRWWILGKVVKQTSEREVKLKYSCRV